jgi:hypothetical protein
MTNMKVQKIRNNEIKLSNLIINLFLLLGVFVLVFTLFYMLFHLDISDKIIFRCIPGFALGLSSILVYGFLYHKKRVNKKGIHL